MRPLFIAIFIFIVLQLAFWGTLCTCFWGGSVTEEPAKTFVCESSTQGRFSNNRVADTLKPGMILRNQKEWLFPPQRQHITACHMWAAVQICLMQKPEITTVVKQGTKLKVERVQLGIEVNPPALEKPLLGSAGPHTTVILVSTPGGELLQIMLLSNASISNGIPISYNPRITTIGELRYYLEFDDNQVSTRVLK